MISSVSVINHAANSHSQRLARTNAPSSMPKEVAHSEQSSVGGQLFQHAGDVSWQHYQALSSNNNAADSAASSDKYSAEIKIEDLTKAFQSRFASAASDKAQFHSLLEKTLGDSYDVNAAETIRQQSLEGDFSWMPNVEVVNSQTLTDSSGIQQDGVGLGAYSAQTDTIYLNEQLLEGDTEKALQILVEETGHALDAQLNISDASGDEGELFARLLSGDTLDAEQLAVLKTENDSGSIVVDGQEIEVEFGWLKRAARKIKKEVKRVGRQIDDNIIQPVKQSGDIIVRGTEALVKATVGRVARENWNLVKGLARSAKQGLINGDWPGAWDTLKTTAVNFATTPARIWIESRAIALHTIVGVWDTLRGDLNVRKLNTEEVEQRRGIFGDSIDYSKIRIQSGGSKDQLGMRANVIGNDIFMPREHGGQAVFEDDGTLTTAGMVLLGHEVAHVWQYQNEGTNYISESLMGQANHGLFGDITGAPDPYSWRSDVAAGVNIKDLGAEQQAEIAEVIGMALIANGGQDPDVPFTEDELARVLNYSPADTMPGNFYAFFLSALEYFHNG